MSDTPGSKQNTAAFYGQAVASFAVAMAATAIGIYQLSADAWVRGFLAIAVLYLVTSSFTLAKVIRDRQEGPAGAAGMAGAAPTYSPYEKH
ncbi:YiaA/YiaB family inner membrane protein [Streptomyces sp. NPDC006235]|uniref:YiaA/YiaB family inner membrane protein n=1 Tax=Streptomyces sp. NPDC006235 TaxID=3156736 RepID=UPI0033B59ACC